MSRNDLRGATSSGPEWEGELEDERVACLALGLCEGLGPVSVARLREAHGSASAALAGDGNSWAMAIGCSVERAAILLGRVPLDAARRELDAGRQRGASLVVLGDDAYPALLAAIPAAPPFLWTRGAFDARDAWSIAIVGSRRATPYGLDHAARFARALAEAGHPIVSGGARGIDAEAHRAALRAGARTVAVLGSGLGCPYPPEHARLFDEIATSDGVVVSEFPLGMAPRRELFPRRNRVVSGLSIGVVVVEARLRSGASITARLAVEEHGREAMALPGRVDSPASEGCHRAIREGWAALVASPSEVLDQLSSAGLLVRGAMDRLTVRKPLGSPACSALQPPRPRLTDLAMRIGRALIDHDAITADALVASIDLDACTAGQLMGELTLLELMGLVARVAGGRYSARAEFRELLEVDG